MTMPNLDTHPARPATLPQLCEAGSPDQAAIVVPGGSEVTYAQFLQQSSELAGRLRSAGVEAGDVVSMVLGNDLSFLHTFFAVSMIGATAAPLNPAYTLDEFRSFMEDAAAQVVVLAPDATAASEAATALDIPKLRAEPREDGETQLSRDGASLAVSGTGFHVEPDLPVLFLHTSGTTSRPKGVPLTHANLTLSAHNIVSTYDLAPWDVALCVVPLFHVHGLIGVALSTFASGGTLVLPPRFSAGAFWPDVAAHKPTWYSAVPTIHQILMRRAEDDDAPRGVFRFIRSCSAAMTPTLFTELEERFEAPVLEAYGMTEAAHQMASNPLPPGARLAGTVGFGTGVEVSIADERGKLLEQGSVGEVVIRGPNVMQGYRNNPEANASSFVDGWFRTGDQGRMEATGHLRLTGRLKELINRGGEKISPLEVDAVLAEHPLVAEAVSFGVPDPMYGEEVHAAVVLGGEVTRAELERFCKERLAAFKVPKVFHIVDALPRTATGKVQRRQVAASLTEPEA